jgi:hypothetical protein
MAVNVLFILIPTTFREGSNVVEISKYDRNNTGLLIESGKSIYKSLKDISVKVISLYGK